MQSAEIPFQKNCLGSAMGRCLSAIHNMEQLVMLPSLLRDIPIEECERSSTDLNSKDLYEYYVALKSIRNIAVSGLVSVDENKTNNSVENIVQTNSLDLDVLFLFHLKGLHSVLNSLTKNANTLTKKYKEIIGLRH
ncbi:mid1-interacting protein 1-B-like [Protopterus annectens]|uniref:mid1-interacting protein 1-B-like n=1 Tax=Protopterus annectens TaxID=7888 RepID=UPI001CFA20A6|nr:mid1-interacting protein 1-B-like [Protopterus annectens]